jgi:uncharacterized delta-60 repeat protein
MSRRIFIVLVLGTLTFSLSPAQGQEVIEAWVARYNGTWNLADQATALALDNAGNVHVTGLCQVSTDFDYATVKYDPDGNPLWYALYEGPGSLHDAPTALALDDSGNVYVTGESTGSGTYDDYATVKYNANGTVLWVTRYDGGFTDDEAYALAVDDSGNVYVTGKSWGVGNSVDYATLKYDVNGTELWVARYNGPLDYHDQAYALTLDDSGNVYVTGYSFGNVTSEDYATIKYNTDGVELWVARYDTPGPDIAYALALDDSGNAYVTGESWGTYMDYLTLKYDPDGNQIWEARYNGPGNGYDKAEALALDDAGNVYVTGYSEGIGTSNDYATIKYDPGGNELWVTRYDGPGNGDDVANTLAVDDSGNVYVTGYSEGSGTQEDYATIKYDPDGNQLWEIRYNGPGDSTDYANALAVDNSGNVYVTGYSEGSGTQEDYATIKYSEIVLGVENDPSTAIPDEFALRGPYPNPFNPVTTFKIELPVASWVTLEIFDVSGRSLGFVVDGWRSAGYHEVTFDAVGLASGVYVYRLEAGDYNVSGKMVLMK